MVQDLIQAYAEQIAQMANSGMSQTQLARRTEQLKRQFVDQMVQMGYSRKEANEYARAFDDLAYSIRNVPRNITVSANTDPGRRAVQEFLASVKKSSASVNVGVGGLPTGATTRGLGESAGRAYAKGWVEQAKKYRRMLIQKDRSLPGGKRYSVDGGQTWFLQKGGPVPEYHATGGVHGMHPGSPRGSDTTPAWLTPGEFVQNRTAVDYYGLPFMNALNNMQIPKYLSVGGPATGSRSSSGGGPTLVELLPTQIRQIIDGLAVRIDIDGNEIASTVNRHNVRTTQRGTN